MKTPLAALAGIALIVVSGFFLFNPPSFTAHPVTPWLATAVLIGGFALLVGGIRRKV
jgi:hypothetical protein